MAKVSETSRHGDSSVSEEALGEKKRKEKMEKEVKVRKIRKNKDYKVYSHAV